MMDQSLRVTCSALRHDRIRQCHGLLSFSSSEEQSQAGRQDQSIRRDRLRSMVRSTYGLAEPVRGVDREVRHDLPVVCTAL